MAIENGSFLSNRHVVPRRTSRLCTSLTAGAIRKRGNLVAQ